MGNVSVKSKYLLC